MAGTSPDTLRLHEPSRRLNGGRSGERDPVPDVKLSVPVLRAAKLAVDVVPRRVARPIARGLGGVASRISTDERLVVRRNLERIHPGGVDDWKMPDMVADVYRNYAAYWFDSLDVTNISHEDLVRRVTVEGLDNLMVPIAGGTGVVAAIPHLGSWEAGARWLSEVAGIRVVAAVEKLEPPELYDWFVRYRTDDLGIEVVPVDGQASQKLAAALAEGAMLTLLCDRDINGDGVEVEFFGERTTLPGGPALLALRTNSPLVPLAVYQRGDDFHGVVLEALDVERRGRLREDVARITQDLAWSLEELIRRAPTQWHVLQPNWPSDLEAVRRRAERRRSSRRSGSVATDRGPSSDRRGNA